MVTSSSDLRLRGQRSKKGSGKVRVIAMTQLYLVYIVFILFCLKWTKITLCGRQLRLRSAFHNMSRKLMGSLMFRNTELELTQFPRSAKSHGQYHEPRSGEVELRSSEVEHRISEKYMKEGSLPIINFAWTNGFADKNILRKLKTFVTKRLTIFHHTISIKCYQLVMHTLMKELHMIF